MQQHEASISCGWTSHLWIWDGNSGGVLVVSVPGVLYSVDLCVVKLHVRHVLPPRWPPQALAGWEHLLWKGGDAHRSPVYCLTSLHLLVHFQWFHLPSYTQSGIPFRIWFSLPLTVTRWGAELGPLFMYTSLFQTKAWKYKVHQRFGVWTFWRPSPRVFGKGWERRPQPAATWKNMGVTQGYAHTTNHQSARAHQLVPFGRPGKELHLIRNAGGCDKCAERFQRKHLRDLHECSKGFSKLRAELLTPVPGRTANTRL